MTPKTYTDDEVREAIRIAEILTKEGEPWDYVGMRKIETMRLIWAAGEWLSMKSKRPECYSSTCGYIEPKS